MYVSGCAVSKINQVAISRPDFLHNPWPLLLIEQLAPALRSQDNDLVPHLKFLVAGPQVEPGDVPLLCSLSMIRSVLCRGLHLVPEILEVLLYWLAQ